MKHAKLVRNVVMAVELVVVLLFMFDANAQISTDKLYPVTSKVVYSPLVDELFKKTRLFCFGRFVMEIPAGSNIVYGPAQADGDLIFHEGGADKIERLGADRVSQVETEKTYIPAYEIAEFPMIGKVVNGAVPGQKIVYGTSSGGAYSVYSYIPAGSDLFVHQSSILIGSDELHLINRVAKQLRLRSEQEIPPEPGICVERGFLSAESTYENVAVGLNFKEFLDVRFSADIRKNQDYLPEGSSPKELRKRAQKSAEQRGLGDFFARIKILREGAKSVGVWEGEEILSRRPPYKGETDAHEFRFFSTGSTNDVFHPKVDIRMDTGVKDNDKASVRPSLSDKDALALWDRLLSTIRLRVPSNKAVNAKQ